MISISGYFNNDNLDIGYEINNVPIFINSCGKQMFIKNGLKNSRPQGRLDYQLIYIYNGSGYFNIDGEMKKLSQGNIVLFKPYKPQFYSYEPRDNCEIYWIHFTGFEVENIILDIENKYIGIHTELKAIFNNIIVELQLKKTHYSQICISEFEKLILLIRRINSQKVDNTGNNKTLENFVIELNESYGKEWNISKMAEYCNFSVDYFAHIFKGTFQISPIHFLNNLRIEKAKTLLLHSDMTILSISKFVGFNDQLYFSRAFKKATGFSPSSYRKQIK